MDGSSLAPFFSPLLFFNLSYCIQLVVAIKRKLSVVQAPALAKENKSANAIDVPGQGTHSKLV
jgi:hypothetical protein